MKSKIILAAILMITLPLAYAETSTVEVPFDSHGQSCNFDEIAVEYHCTWQGIIDKFTVEDLKQYKSILPQDIYDQEIQRLNEEALAEIAIEKAKLTPNELTIQKIEDKLDRGVATASDSVLMNLLKQLDTCQQGMDTNTAPFQGAREVTKSSWDKWTYNNVQYKGQVGEIVLAIEECRAQVHMFKAGVGYQNFPTGVDDYQFSLQDVYTRDIQAIPYSQWTETNSGINSSLICDSNQHSQQYKQQFGCVILYDGLDAESIKAQNELRFGTDGVINYQSKVLDNYMKFIDTYGNQQATTEDKKVQEDIAFPIAEAWKANNNFYQNSLRD
jgi:hypothetical protein